MRILHVLDHSLPLHSGYAFRTRAIMKAQIAQGWDVRGLTGPRHLAERAVRDSVDGLTFYRTPQPKESRSPLQEIREIKALRRRLAQVVAQWRPDQIHVHSPVLNALAVAPLAKREKIPLVYEIRAFWEDAAVGNGTGSEGSPRYHATRWLETRAARNADGVAVICEGLRDDLVARGIAKDKIVVAPNGVDLELFGDPPAPDEELARSLGLQGCEVVGFIGSFYDYEGIDDLIAAMPRLAMRRPRAKLLLVGGGPKEAALRAQAAASPSADRIVFVGRVPHEQVEKYYGLIDILAYPRKAMRLTELVTPLKPLEAMAQRRLVVASNVGGHRELIEDNVTGTLFPAGDPTALAETLAGMFADRSNWEARREAGRAFVERDRNWASNISRYAPIYRALTGAPKVDRTKVMTGTWLKKISDYPFEMPLGSALGSALAFALFAMPDPLFDAYFAATGLPFLGFAGRMVAALGLGALAGWGTWRGLLAAGETREAVTIDLTPKFIPRRADAHPDAPPRRPIFAAADLGAPLDSITATPPRRRDPARAAVPSQGETAAAAPNAGPEDVIELTEVVESPVPEIAGPEPVAAFLPESPAPLAPEPQPISAPAVELATEQEQLPSTAEPDAIDDSASIAALMQRLEDGLAQHPNAPPPRPTTRAWLTPEVHHPAPPAAKNSWLVRDDREPAQKNAQQR